MFHNSEGFKIPGRFISQCDSFWPLWEHKHPQTKTSGELRGWKWISQLTLLFHPTLLIGKILPVLDILIPYVNAVLGWTKACLATAVRNCRALLGEHPWSSACQKCQSTTRTQFMSRSSGSSTCSLKHQASPVYKLLGFHHEVSISPPCPGGAPLSSVSTKQLSQADRNKPHPCLPYLCQWDRRVTGGEQR